MNSKAVDVSAMVARAQGHLDMVEAGLKAAMGALEKANQPVFIAELEELRSRLKAGRSALQMQASASSRKPADYSDVMPINEDAIQRLKPKFLYMASAIDEMSEDEYGQWVDALERDEFLEFMRVAHDEAGFRDFLKLAKEEQQTA